MKIVVQEFQQEVQNIQKPTTSMTWQETCMTGPWRPTIPAAGFCVGADTTILAATVQQGIVASAIRTPAATKTVAGLHCMSSKNLLVPPVARANFRDCQDNCVNFFKLISLKR